MTMKSLLATLLVVPLLAISAGAQARTTESNPLPPAYQTGGREVAAPPWSFACTTQCGEPMWVYGSRAATARYGSPF
jgi:hypothetical protein